jgi:ring-1,2-phenylacetyl-CoA epoxidase subunit PaaE
MKSSTVEIILDGMSTVVEIENDKETILNAALDAGLDAPYSCKGGVCTTCRAKLLAGEVHMKLNFALTDSEVQKGYILACQSLPVSENIVMTWDE